MCSESVAPTYTPVLLPKTDFSPRPAPALENDLVRDWFEGDLHVEVRNLQESNFNQWILHDGPPYANGDVHVGHALNKIMKDALIRLHRSVGFNSTFTPGWDCHGLPIESQVEKNLNARGLSRHDVSVLEFRQECRDWANLWIERQAKGFRRMGVLANWDTPYITMSHHGDASTLNCLYGLLNAGFIRNGRRPVQWSVAEGTALANAEVVMKESRRQEVTVLFPVHSSDVDALKVPNSYMVCWTSTPWSLPGNKAVAVNPDVHYGVYQIQEVEETSHLKEGMQVVLSQTVAELVLRKSGCLRYVEVANFEGNVLSQTVCHHPLYDLGFHHDVPVLMAEFVASDVGTGAVHIAPELGPEDFALGLENKLVFDQETVTSEGHYGAGVPHFAGMALMTPNGTWGEAQGRVVEALEQAGMLVSKWYNKTESAHSWRSGTPLFYRATSQWWLSMKEGFLERAVEVLQDVKFLPDEGSRNRLISMLQDRPDWCISRQRQWGVPIAIFTNKLTGEVLLDKDVQHRIYTAFLQEGSDAWWKTPHQEFLGDLYNVEDWEACYDVLDVWFESGATWSWVMPNSYGQTVADLYLEGSDQHRGWFQSSLLESVALQDKSPFKAVMTHGFVLDGKGRKMSKSEGNVVDPLEVCDRLGADVLRLWVLSSNSGDDIRWSEEIAKTHTETLRKFRNTLKWLLGNLPKENQDVFLEDKKEIFENYQFEEPELWMLSRLSEMGKLLRQDVANYDTPSLLRRLLKFCSEDLSAFWFDMRKDCLYCDAESSERRRHVMAVVHEVYLSLVKWLAPMLPFTAEEAWNGSKSVHLEQWQALNEVWWNPSLMKEWEFVRNIRQQVLAKADPKLKSRELRAVVEAEVVIQATPHLLKQYQEMDWSTIFGVSNVVWHETQEPFSLEVSAFNGHSCPRCRAMFKELTTKGLCRRCDEV